MEIFSLKKYDLYGNTTSGTIHAIIYAETDLNKIENHNRILYDRVTQYTICSFLSKMLNKVVGSIVTFQTKEFNSPQNKGKILFHIAYNCRTKEIVMCNELYQGSIEEEETLLFIYFPELYWKMIVAGIYRITIHEYEDVYNIYLES